AATPVFADAVEELGRLRVEQVRPPKWAGAVRMLLQPVAHATYGTFAEQIARQRRFRDKQIEAARRNAELHAQRQAEKARILAERQARHEAERKARLEAKLRAREQQLLLKGKEREAKRRDREKRWARKRRQGMKRKLAGLVRSVLGRAAGL